jgi:hypothetical protein
MKNFIIYLLLGILLFNCSKKNNHAENTNFTLEPTNDTIQIPLGKKETSSSFLDQYFFDNDSNYLAVLSLNNHSIFVYNMDKQRLYKEIKIEEEGVNAFPGMFGYVMKNLDTVILISLNLQRVAILNNEGEILKSISIVRDKNGKGIIPAFPWSPEQGILNGNFLYILQEFAIQQYSGKLSPEQQKQSLVAARVDLENGEVISLPLNYPEKLIDKDIFEMRKCWMKGNNNCFLFTFSILGDLFVTQNFSSFKEIPIQTDYQLVLPENIYKYSNDFQKVMDYKAKKDIISDLFYDEYRSLYYIFVDKRKENTANEKTTLSSLSQNCLLIILDKDFNHLGDVHLPENTYYAGNLFITQKGIYISENHLNNPSYNEDAMKYRLFKIKE